jgi:hypothetical protein
MASPVGSLLTLLGCGGVRRGILTVGHRAVCVQEVCCRTAYETKKKDVMSVTRLGYEKELIGVLEVVLECPIQKRNKAFCMTRLGYEKELIGVLEGLVRDMDRKIERQKERADKESAPKALNDADRAKLDDMLARQKGAPPAATTATPGCGCGQLEPASAACCVGCALYTIFRCIAEAATPWRRGGGGSLTNSPVRQPAPRPWLTRGSCPQLSKVAHCSALPTHPKLL